MAEENKSSLDPLAALCKRRGFIYHSSEIYGGMPGFWDYGPLGCELKQNVKQAWWQFTVRGRSDVAGLDATIIMHPKIWKASGHLDTFADPMTMCKQCKKLLWDGTHITNDAASDARLEATYRKGWELEV